MEKNEFIAKNDIEQFLQQLVIGREVFDKRISLDMWKGTYENIRGVQEQIDATLSRWKKTANFKEVVKHPLDELKSCTNEFVKKCMKKGQKRGDWQGASDECETLLENFREKSRPLIKELMEHLEAENPVRLDIESMI